MLVRDNTPEVWRVRDWLDSWSGIGLIIGGMTHQGWDVQLTAYAARDWRANFFPVGIAHSLVTVLSWRCLPPGLRQTQQASDPLASGLTQPQFAHLSWRARRGHPDERACYLDPRSPRLALADCRLSRWDGRRVPYRVPDDRRSGRGGARPSSASPRSRCSHRASTLGAWSMTHEHSTARAGDRRLRRHACTP